MMEHYNECTMMASLPMAKKQVLLVSYSHYCEDQVISSAIKVFLCNQIDLRKKWQKFEFLSCWIFILLLLICSSYTISLYFPRIIGVVRTLTLIIVPSQQNLDVGVQGQSDHDDVLVGIPLLVLVVVLAKYYVKISIITRFLAYAVDFANASKKIGSLPSWLILHHAGVFIVHALLGFYFLCHQSHYLKTIFCMLALQSTHNTWTKKYSLVLYWCNVLLGVITSVTILLHELRKEGEFPWIIYQLVTIGVSIGITGAFLLFRETVLLSQQH